MIKKLLIVLLLLTGKSYAGDCSSSFLSIPTEVNWRCVFPISIGGVTTIGDNGDETSISDPVCACGNPPTVGLTVSFWEPARVIDTVQDAYCMNAIGAQLNSASLQDGTITTNMDGNTPNLFAQMHYYKFPVWAILDMFTDLPCTEKTSFDIAMMSELLPHWNNPILASILNPEAIVFGNPIAQLACGADSIAATSGNPLDTLFWCMGSWGGAYPFSGSIGASDSVVANAGIAARSIYMMGRTGLLLDSGIDACGAVPTPIWKKSNYKLQLMRPVRQSSCMPIGKSGFTWSTGKSKTLGGGNYSWMVFRKVKCCIGYSF